MNIFTSSSSTGSSEVLSVVTCVSNIAAVFVTVICDSVSQLFVT